MYDVSYSHHPGDAGSHREYLRRVNGCNTNRRISLSQHETFDPRTTPHVQDVSAGDRPCGYACSLPSFSHNLGKPGPANKKLCGIRGPQVLGLRAAQIEGRLAWTQGDFSQAEEWCQKGLALYREVGEMPGIALSLYRLGWVGILRGDHARARLLLEESLADFRELDDSLGIGDALRALDNISLIQGEYANASELLEQSLTLYRGESMAWGWSPSSSTTMGRRALALRKDSRSAGRWATGRSLPSISKRWQ